MKLLASFCAFALLISSVFAADPPPKGERVFITSHSFHGFVASKLGYVTKAAGIEGHVLVGHQSIGGSRVLQHWNLPEEGATPPPANAAPATPAKRPQFNIAKAALAAGKVDVFTMSPHMTYMPDEGIDGFVELGTKHNPKLRLFLQQSWPTFDGWLPNEKLASKEERDTRSLDILRVANQRFRDALEAQTTALNQKLGRDAVFIIPAGDAVLKLREMIAAGQAPGLTKQSDLFTDVIGHGTQPLLALTTYCNFACIYRMSPVGLPDNDPTLDKLSPALRPLLQQIAWDTVSKYPFSRVAAEKKVAKTD